MLASRGYEAAKSFYLSKLFWNGESINNQSDAIVLSVTLSETNGVF